MRVVCVAILCVCMEGVSTVATSYWCIILCVHAPDWHTCTHTSAHNLIRSNENCEESKQLPLPIAFITNNKLPVIVVVIITPHCIERSMRASKRQSEIRKRNSVHRTKWDFRQFNDLQIIRVAETRNSIQVNRLIILVSFQYAKNSCLSDGIASATHTMTTNRDGITVFINWIGSLLALRSIRTTEESLKALNHCMRWAILFLID